VKLEMKAGMQMYGDFVEVILLYHLFKYYRIIKVAVQSLVFLLRGL
jgi:hypothetical protein